jgi:hypothetical protein
MAKINAEYEILSPWADIDPLPLKGIAPRLTSLAGKKIGLFALSKRASRPIVLAVGEKLKERFPGLKTVLYDSYTPFTVMQIETENKQKFEDWVKGVDAVVAAVGD